jgi:hypothetical protein
VRDFTDLSEGDYPWLDGVAAEIPYNNLTVTMEVKDCHFYLIDDWGSFESRPEFTADKLVGVGLYTSDVLSDGYIPVGMESADALADTFETLTSKFKAATVTLWKNMSGWSRDQMMDAGAIIYFSMIKDFAHIAGVYDVDDWMTIDVRADRFRPLLNDEFGRDFLGEMVGLVDLPSQQISPYSMMQHTNRPARYLTLVPPSAIEADAPATCGPLAQGVSHHPPKQGRYLTTAGPLSLADYNAQAQAFKSPQMSPEHRYLSDSWIKWNRDDPRVDALYRLEQRASRRLAGRGAGLTPEDIEALRADDQAETGR